MTQSLNREALRRFREVLATADQLRVDRVTDNLIDFGVTCPGSVRAGVILAEICMGGLGHVSVNLESLDSPEPWANDNGTASRKSGTGEAVMAARRGYCERVHVETAQPALSCMGAQYGGWPVSTDSFFAIGSGPMRLRRGREPVLEKYGLTECDPGPVVGVLESDTLPDASVVEAVAEACSCQPDDVYLCVAPTGSLAGGLQIVARSVESVMHKLYELEIDLTRITSALGSAPLPLPIDDFGEAIGRTNDAILYGGIVTLWCDLEAGEIEEKGPLIPSGASASAGRPFAEIFRECGGDFYQLDPLLFSAAQVTLISRRAGRAWTFGRTRPDLVQSVSE